MPGLVIEGSTIEQRQPNAIGMPEWLEQKMLEEIRAAYVYGVEQAAKAKDRGLKNLENGMRERMVHIGGQLLQASLERGLGNGYEGGSIACGCGGRMRYVADRSKVLSTWLRDIRISRAYYHCPKCKTGRFPLDEALGIAGSSFSPTIREAICLTNAEMSFERGQELLERLTGIRVSVEEGRLIAEDQGRQLELEFQDEIAKVWRPKAPKPREACSAPQRLYVSPDGTHIPIRGQKEWSEVKVATIFTTGIPSEGGDPVREVTRYVGGLEKAEIFYKRLYVEALKQRIDEAGEIVVIGDGAEWIWNQAELTLPKNRVEIIDYYHATEKLWTLARAVWGEENKCAKQWAGRWSDKLYEGKVAQVMAAMSRVPAKSETAREVLRTTIGYFKTNKHRMRYDELRKKGYFIGSGITESSCKHLVGTRLKQAGMHWDKQQAQAILQLRLARLNGRWDHIWN
jgi:hypothetical protein